MNRVRFYGALFMAFAVLGGLPTRAAAATFGPVISVSSIAVIEGNSGTRNLSFLVTLSQPGDDVSFHFATSDSGATGVANRDVEGGDYLMRNGTASMKPGAVTRVINVPVLGDTTDEDDEAVTLTLSNVVNAEVGIATGTGTILDDDPGSGFRLGIGDISVAEGDSTARSMTVVVGFSDPAPAAFTMGVTTADGTAHGAAKPTSTSDADYVSKNKTVSVRAGRRFATFGLRLLTDDVDEGTESFTVTITSPIGTVTRATATVTIFEEDTDEFAYVHEWRAGPPVVATDNIGDAAVAGTADAAVPGAPEPYAGADDGYVVKFDANGSRQWSHLLGSAGQESLSHVAVDATGAVYVSGTTFGTLPGSSEPGRGVSDVFVARYNADGTFAWLHQIGTVNADRNDGLEVDASGNALVAATYDRYTTADAVVARYEPDGTLDFVHHRGATTPYMFYAQEYAGTAGFGSNERFDSAGNIVVAGPLFDGDAPNNTLSRYDAGGNLLWSKNATAISADIGFTLVYINRIDVSAEGEILFSGTVFYPYRVGTTTLVAFAAAVVRYHPDGTLAWTRVVSAVLDGLSIPDVLNQGGVFTSTGDIVAVGVTTGVIPTTSGDGHNGLVEEHDDGIAVKWSTDGTYEWGHEFGSPEEDGAVSVTADSVGGVIIAGVTFGSVKYSPEAHVGDSSTVNALIVKFR